MKRRGFAFAVMLCAVMLMKLGLPVLAERIGTNDGYARSLTYCEGVEAPVSATITAALDESQTKEEKQKEFSFTTEYVDGETARAIVRYAAPEREVPEEQWEALGDWLSQILRRAIPQTAQLNAQDMAQRLLEEIERAREAATPDENGQTPVYAQSDILLYQVQVSAPYYPELSRGSRGEEVRRLQQRLITLGYLEGEADGQFGKITATAIEEAQRQLRGLEQAAIDREQAAILAAATPAPTAAPDATPAPTPEPAPAPTPATQVNGAADQVFQIQLYSEKFPLIGGALEKGADAAAVTRLQRRLVMLGCLTGGVDGDYGGNTRRGVRIFQHYNGLSETGIADEATQRAVFSDAAKAPDNPLMALGVQGDAVTKLQNRLIALGFMKGTADGDYGATTKSAVENLQAYLREMEIEALTRKAGVVPAAAGEGASAPVQIAVTPTIEINGVADPLLLDQFYGADFPAVPPTKKNGDADLDVTRIQRRLWALEYVYTAPDGQYGDGTESAVRAFQKRNGLTQDGVAGRGTLETLFSNEALKALKPYVLKVSVSKQRVYAYGLDENNEHTVLVRTMKCSTGLSATPTPKGTYQSSTGPGARWHYFKKFSCWAQYAFYIQGDIMFHSVLYNQKDGPVTSSSVRNLGSRASHGCVRLSVEDAKWIYQNCPQNTKVVVY